MAIEDKTKWDKKYKNTPSLLKDRLPSKNLINIINKIKKGKALDIACGAGKNSIYLATKGFKVDALDISQVALDSLNKKNLSNINIKLIDLEGYVPEENNYDIVVMTNYLDRDIIPKLFKALKKAGVLFIETYMEHKTNTKPNSNPDFLLKQGELKSFFNDNYEILEYGEFDNEPEEMYRMKKQFIIIKKL